MLTRDAALHYTYRFQTEILYWFHTAKEVNFLIYDSLWLTRKILL